MKEWRQVVGFEDLYSVSNDGQVKRTKGGQGNTKVGRILKPLIRGGGYHCVTLYVDGHPKTRPIHQLVLETFGTLRPSSDYGVNHINGIKDDNMVENLEWMTKSENTKHAHQTGLADNKGEKNGHAKLTESDVLEIRHRYDSENITCRELSDVFDVNEQMISHITSRRSWQHI